MKQLTINRARTLGKDMNAKGIVILAFGDDGELQACSYGRTKQDCGQLGKWLDGIYDAIESGEMAAPFVEQQSPERLTGPSDDTPVSSDDILRAGESPPFIQVGMVLRPMGAAGATIPSAGDGDFNDGPRTVVAVEKPFGEPAYAKLIPGHQNSATLQERCDWLRKYWVLVNDFDTSAESLHLATDLP